MARPNLQLLHARSQQARQEALAAEYRARADAMQGLGYRASAEVLFAKWQSAQDAALFWAQQVVTLQ